MNGFQELDLFFQCLSSVLCVNVLQRFVVQVLRQQNDNYFYVLIDFGSRNLEQMTALIQLYSKYPLTLKWRIWLQHQQFMKSLSSEALPFN